MACNKFVYLAIALAAFCTVQSLVVDYKDCGSKLGKIVEVLILPCKVQPCALVKGTNATIQVMFIPDIAVSTVKVSLKGEIFGALIPFPIPHEDACKYKQSKLHCPLKPGLRQVYQLVLPVKQEYPKLKLEAVLSLEDEEKKSNVICAMIPVKITD